MGGARKCGGDQDERTDGRRLVERSSTLGWSPELEMPPQFGISFFAERHRQGLRHRSSHRRSRDGLVRVGEEEEEEAKVAGEVSWEVGGWQLVLWGRALFGEAFLRVVWKKRWWWCVLLTGSVLRERE